MPAPPTHTTHSPPLSNNLSNTPYHPHMLKQHARNHRNNPTDAEHHLWQHIRMGQIDGHRFLRQKVIDNMIVDFICRGRKLIIELDGGQHDLQHHADNLRTKRLNKHGYRVLRFWNNQVLINTQAVLQTIQQALNEET